MAAAWAAAQPQPQPAAAAAAGAGPRAVDSTTTLPVLTHLRDLSIMTLEVAGLASGANAAVGASSVGAAAAPQLARLAPHLTRLALGVAPTRAAAALAGLTAGEADATLAAWSSASAAAAHAATMPRAAAAAGGAGAGAGGLHIGQNVHVGPAVQQGHQPAEQNQPGQLPTVPWLNMAGAMTDLAELHLAGASCM